MSENVEGQTTEGAEGQNNVTPEMIEKLQSQLDHLKSTNDRLLNESKDWKAKYQGVKDEVRLKVAFNQFQLQPCCIEF